MSMNLNVIAKLEVFDKKGKKRIISESPYLWQTPTKVSYELIKQENVLEAYCAWVMSRDVLDVKECYLGSVEEQYSKELSGLWPDYLAYYSAGAEHIKELKEKIEFLLAEGYKIEYYVV